MPAADGDTVAVNPTGTPAVAGLAVDVSAVDVAWTRGKYVRKQKGAPGAVTFSQDKSVLVRPDPERLARLALVGDTA